MSEAASPEQQVRCHIYASGWTRLAIRALIRLAPRLREVPPHQRASLSLMVVSDDVSWESVKAVRDNPLSRQLVLCSRRVDDDLRRQAAEHGVTVMSLSIVTQGMETFLLGAAAPHRPPPSSPSPAGATSTTTRSASASCRRWSRG